MTNETAEGRAYARGFEDGIHSNSETIAKLQATAALVPHLQTNMEKCREENARLRKEIAWYEVTYPQQKL